MKRFSITAFVFLFLASQAHAASFIDALAQQESGNKPLSPHWDVNAIRLGYFQISEDCWLDATEHNKIGGSWKQCQNDREYAAKIVMLYLKRYCPKAVAANDYETMARVWNGGPSGATKKTTVPYARNVMARMEK